MKTFNKLFLSNTAVKALPTFSGRSVVYNPEQNVFLTMGYTSNAGNTYYSAIRLSNRLAVCLDIGEGYKYIFLNGITLYAWDGKKVKIIAKKTWGWSNWKCFSESAAMEECIRMLKNYLARQAKALGYTAADRQLLSFSRSLIEETYQKQLR